jgi:hypothetical protein
MCKLGKSNNYLFFSDVLFVKVDVNEHAISISDIKDSVIVNMTPQDIATEFNVFRKPTFIYLKDDVQAPETVGPLRFPFCEHDIKWKIHL